MNHPLKPVPSSHLGRDCYANIAARKLTARVSRLRAGQGTFGYQVLPQTKRSVLTSVHLEIDDELAFIASWLPKSFAKNGFWWYAMTGKTVSIMGS